MPSLLILIPLFGVLILNLPFKDLMKRLAFPFAIVLFSMHILIAVFQHPVFWTAELERMDSFFKASFSVDHLSFIIFLCIGIVSLAALIVARYTIFEEKDRFKFINLLIIISIGMSGIAMVRDVFSLYVFIEITAFTAFVLIAFQKDLDGLEGAFKYLVLSSVATVLMLLSISMLLLISKDTSFLSIAESLRASPNSLAITFAVCLFMCGVFIKSGLVPFHGWLPDAYTAAPAPVSVLLAGIVTKTAGIYTLIRLTVSLFGMEAGIKNVLLAIGALSVVIGAFAALGQNNFKRLLSYSSISQMGYIVLGIGCGTPLGIVGGAFHLFNHSIFKSLLFVNSAAIERQIGTNNMERMGGLSEKMPVTGATSVVGILSTCGIPPLAGFWSKLIIIIALWKSGNYAYSAVAVMASLVTLAYLLSVQRKVFFGKLNPDLEDIGTEGFGFVFVSITLALITIGTGLCFPFFLKNFIVPVKDILIR